MSAAAPIAVLGSGVVGLTTAVRLLERAAPVTIYTDRRPPRLASAVAPAMFTPYAGSDPGRSRGWANAALDAYLDLERREPEAGVRTFPLREYCYGEPHYSILADRLGERPGPVPPAGVRATIDSVRPHVDTTRLLPWLEARVGSLGGRVVREQVSGFDALFARGHSVVVNCAGVGARALTGDPILRAMRGLVLHCRHNPGLTRSLHDDAPNNVVTYVFVYGDHLALGSTYERDQWEETFDERAAAAIIDRCCALARMDGVAGWEEIGRDVEARLVGLRPIRGAGGLCEDIRLEAERVGPGRTIVHNYGHGRSGVTLAWGTAAEAAGLALEAL